MASIYRDLHLSGRADGPAVTVGRLSPEKDIQTLLRAAAIVAKQEPGFRLRVLGSGPCLDELEQLRDQLNLRANVELPGQVSNVAAELAGASLFVMSSLTEGISLALLEAMALGLPAVVTRVGGNVEVVADGETGCSCRRNRRKFWRRRSCRFIASRRWQETWVLRGGGASRIVSMRGR